MIWSYSEFFRICLEASDVDWLNEFEMQSVDFAAQLMTVGYAALSESNRIAGRARWPMKPKHHAIWEINRHIQNSSRNPAAMWAFSERSDNESAWQAQAIAAN